MAKRKTRRGRRRNHSQDAAWDFIGIVISVLVIAICVVLLSSLAEWLSADFRDTFALLGKTVAGAVFTGR